MQQYIFIARKISAGVGNEIQLTDAIKLMLEDQNILAFEYTGAKFDCGSKSGYVEATMFMALRDKDIKLDLQKYLNSKF